MPPGNPFLYKDWIEEFQREVEDQIRQIGKTLRKHPRPDPKAASRRAEQGFRDWWESEVDDLADPPASMRDLEINKELEVSRGEIGSLKAEITRLREVSVPENAAQAVEQLRRTADERDALKEDARRLGKELGASRELAASLEEQLETLRQTLARAAAEHAANLKLLEGELRASAARRAQLEADLRSERDARMLAEQALRDHERRLSEVESLRSELTSLRSEIESKMNASIEFLDLKLKSVAEHGKGQVHQLRDLLDALQRLKGRKP